MNKQLFEAVSVNIGNLSREQQDTLIAKRAVVVEHMRKLIANDSDFEASISQSTGSNKNVHYRFAAVKRMFEDVLSTC